MKKNRKILMLLLTLAVPVGYALAKIQPEEKHGAQMRLLDSFLANHHYQHAILDDHKSEEILERYLDILDAGKNTFIKSDIENFRQYEHSLDDFAHKGQLETIFDIYEIYVQRRQAQINWALERLKKPFNDNESDVLELDPEKTTWANTHAELKKRWRKRLINEWITLRLAKQDDEKARKVLTKRYHNIAKHLDESRSDDIFQLYANAVTSVYDPHTTYFSPRTSEDFDINMSLSLEGIGATLTIEEEVITIKELVAGGPAKQSEKLARNDKILGVAQGETGAMEDVVGWRLSDAVRLIRGKKGTKVRLRVERARDNEIVDITLVRDKIKLEESAAKSEIKTVEYLGHLYRIGIIELPSFYIDFEAASRGESNYRSTTRDMKKLIRSLQDEGIDALMIDLRNNGGGSLAEAVDLTGLFFDKGPVVQVRRAEGDLTVHSDEDGKTFYQGPLAVLINENSASASEIFAGAIKDYGRGVILGEPTFGKGTVQTIIDLGRFLPSVSDPVGQLKMTIAMFYRVNGSSTQLRGVKPDIFIPNMSSYVQGGESEEKHALPWHQITANVYSNSDEVEKLIPRLQSQYDQYNSNNLMMKTLLDMMKWQKAEADKTIVSLNLEHRKARRKFLKEKSLQYQNAFRKLYGYQLLNEAYWNKEEKDKTDAELEAEKNEKIDPVLSIATDTVASYVSLLKK